MKKMKINLLFVIMSMAGMFVVSSCEDKDKDPDTESNVPVKGVDFDFTVDGNTVTFTTDLIGNVWFKDITNSKDYTAVDGTIDVFIGLKGMYPFTCNTLIDGEAVTSDTFNVEILQDDITFLNEGIWKALTGGSAGYNKKWRLDDFTSPGGVNYCKYFNGSIGFVDPSNGLTNGILKTNQQWGSYADEYPDFFDGVQDLPEDATISFDGATGKAKLVMTNGIKGSGATAEYWTETVEGTFSLDVVDTANYDEISIASVASQSGGTYGTQAASVTFASPLRFPLDMGVVIDNRFDDETYLTGFDIISCTDSSMVIFAWRQREWGNDSKWGHLWFFICDDYTYTYDDPDAFVAPDRPVKTDGNIEVGTYKLADVPGFWVGWKDVNNLNNWADKNAFLKDMVGWWQFGDPRSVAEGGLGLSNADGSLTAEGQARADSAYSRYSAQTIEFTATNVIVNYKDFSGKDTTYNTTYTVADGVITLTDPISIYAVAPSYTNVSEMYFIDNSLASSGILLGIDNIDAAAQKYESTVINLIKQ